MQPSHSQLQRLSPAGFTGKAALSPPDSCPAVLSRQGLSPLWPATLSKAFAFLAPVTSFLGLLIWGLWPRSSVVTSEPLQALSLLSLPGLKVHETSKPLFGVLQQRENPHVCPDSSQVCLSVCMWGEVVEMEQGWPITVKLLQ